MSYTSLWIIDKNWSGNEHTEYKNSYLFCPVTWDILMCKYIAERERRDEYSKRLIKNFLVWTLYDQNRCSSLNEKINKSEIQYDRVLWELSNMSVFNAKDKDFVADCIEKFVENNFGASEYKDSEHIKERFYEIAKNIRELPNRCTYFVIHPNSVDDNVERWFNEKRLSSWDKVVCEFTIIENNAIIGFADNLSMCKSEGKK